MNRIVVAISAVWIFAALTTSISAQVSPPGGGSGAGGGLPITKIEIINDGAGRCVYEVTGNTLCPREADDDVLEDLGWTTSCSFGSPCIQPAGEIAWLCGTGEPNRGASYQYRFLNGGTSTQVPSFRGAANAQEAEDEAPLELLDLISCYSKKECNCIANELGVNICRQGDTTVYSLARYEIDAGAPCPVAAPVDDMQ